MANPVRDATLRVFNAALGTAGVELVQRTDDNSARAIHLRGAFDSEYNMTLSEIPWNFARRDAVLVAVAPEDAPAGVECDGLFLKPDGFVRLWWEIVVHQSWRRRQNVREEGEFLRSLEYAATVATVAYIGRVRITGVSPRFTNILRLRLARSLSLQFPKGRSYLGIDQLLTEELDKAFAMEVSEAQTDEKPPRRTTAGNIFDVDRESGSGYGFDFDSAYGGGYR